MFLMRKCLVCGAYTFKNIHCGKETISAHPPRFNPNDKWGNIRRKIKGLYNERN